MKASTLTIVMPVLNEAAGLGAALQALAPLLARGAQVIVADGGSADATLAQAGSHAPGVRVLSAPRGRARQMNAGAQQSTSEQLLFLHADTVLPPDADVLIAQALADGARVWGRFDVRIAGRPQALAGDCCLHEHALALVRHCHRGPGHVHDTRRL